MSTKRSPSPESEDQSATPVVLVVDDDEDLADTCEYWLRDDYDVRVAYGGQEALDAADETVDVVLLDRRMPTVSGDDVLESIEERGLDCRIAMMTAVEPDTDIVDMQFDDYLVKPVTKTDVRETVEELLVRSNFEDEVQRFFALESTETVLESRDADELRDPKTLESLRAHVESLRDERADEIALRQRQLDHLHHVNDLLRQVDRAIVDATTREEIEETVCLSVADEESYRGAWIARYNRAMDDVSSRAAAGVDAARLSDLSETVRPLVRDAVESKTVRVVERITDEHREAAFPSEHAPETPVAAIVVPVLYRDTTYGALVVYADGPSEFFEEHVEVFEQLGRSIGNGINAAESKRLLYGDTAVELEFEHDDDDDLFVELTRRLGGTLTLKGFAPESNDSVACYVAADGVDSESLLEEATKHPAVERARIVTQNGSETLFEWEITDSAVLVTFVSFGADVNTLSVTDGHGTVVATVAPDADLRALIDAVQRSFSEISVVAKREVERSVQSTDAFRHELENKLTDRQRDVLETAFVSGYFEWPRGSTAEEVAASLDISAPTFHEHLRSGERKLIETFFDETSPDAGDERARSD
ncbi:bacterio-opsin activator domain-containing protein [Halopelagius longus]|uniref:Predicted DNA binding protein, contains HTH domain n=1 Tax=Halopelagius longus TaxID=1236180 RepID=A0A1H1B114_9EURY|nr:bacterio-opsin activator domain-containing protein [Halopelagius longus]RDI70598.1 response regulator [Halopelagius longus]SDQ45590.1 Predicted DNA binding protein, contains HTH domain [Halopelagius longus]